MFKVSSFHTFAFKINNKKKNILHNAVPEDYSFVDFCLIFLKNAYTTVSVEEGSERTFSSLVRFSIIIITNNGSNEPY